jgi:ubiquinone/menaquinone biosynthesis C-methylase UbiE
MLSREQTAETIREDFDLLADLSTEEWDGNGEYHAYLASHLPARCGRALDVGCGTGSFSRLLAARCDEVLGIDLSPNMIRVARERSKGLPNLTYRVEDVRTWQFPDSGFDCVSSIATLHHLPVEESLVRMARAVRPGGVLLVLDLFQLVGALGFVHNAVAFAASRPLRWVRSGRGRVPREVREAWNRHGRTDTYPSLARIRAVCDRVLPGATVRAHLLWRYSIVWRKGKGSV